MQPNVTGGDVRRRRVAAGRAGPPHRDRTRCVVLCVCVHACDVCVCALCVCSLSLARPLLYIYTYTSRTLSELVMKYFLLLKHLLRSTIRMIVRMRFRPLDGCIQGPTKKSSAGEGSVIQLRLLPRRLPPPVSGEFHFYFEIVIN